MDILLHGWRDSHVRLRLQRSVQDRSCLGARDQCREATELQLFRDYPSKTAIISRFALHEPCRSRQTHSEKSKLSGSIQNSGKHSVSSARMVIRPNTYGSEQVFV